MPFLSKSQILPDSVLFAQLRTCYDLRTQSLKIEFKAIKKAGWKDYLPSAGIGYTPAGHPRPTLSFSLSRYLEIGDKKRDRKNQLAAGLLQIHAAHMADSLQLAAAILDYKNASWPTPFADSTAQIQKQFFEIAAGQLERLQISPEQFLQKKLSYFQSMETAEIRRRELAEKAFRVLTLASGGL